jgi:hypothetical protein
VVGSPGLKWLKAGRSGVDLPDVTDLSHDTQDRTVQPATMVADRVPVGVNPYATAVESRVPHSDVYAALRVDAEEREKQEDFHLTSLSSLMVAPAPETEPAVATTADFMGDDNQVVADDTDLTQVFAGLEGVEAPSSVWRRGDDDVIGPGLPTRSTRRSLRRRRRDA